MDIPDCMAAEEIRLRALRYSVRVCTLHLAISKDSDAERTAAIPDIQE